MAGKKQIDARFLDRVESQLLTTDRGCSISPPTSRAKSGWWVTSTRKASRGARAKVSRIKVDLLLADPSVLEGQRTRRVDSED